MILGSTYTGHYEQVEQVSEILDKYQAETGNDVPIHVDGASGAMFCPFATPSVKFGFEIPRVMSINTYRSSVYREMLIGVRAINTGLCMLVLGGLFSAMKKLCRNISNSNSIISEVRTPRLSGLMG